MYKIFLSVICVCVMVCLCACEHASTQTQSQIFTASDQSNSEPNLAESVKTVQSKLLGIEFDCKSSCLVDDVNTEPLTIIYLDQEKYMLIGLCDLLPDGVHDLPDYALSDVLKTTLSSENTEILQFCNYQQNRSSQVEYARISAEIKTDYSEAYGTEKILRRYNTYYFMKLDTGKMLFAISCDNEDFSSLVEYTSIIESISDAGDSVDSLTPIDEARFEEILLLENTFHGQNE